MLRQTSIIEADDIDDGLMGLGTEKAGSSKLYQVGLHIMDCSTYPATLGQFPFPGGPATCPAITRQGVTDTVAAVEFGVVTTDIHGNGSFKVVVGPIVSGTYALEFDACDGGLQFDRGRR